MAVWGSITAGIFSTLGGLFGNLLIGFVCFVVGFCLASYMRQY